MNGTHSGTDPDHSTSRSGTDITIGPLTVAEAAALLGVEPRTVIKYRQQGKIRGEKQGKAWHLWLAQTFIDTTRAERSGSRSGMDPEQQAARSGRDSASIEAAYRVTPTEIEQAIERTGQKYVTDIAAIYDRVSAELGQAYEGQLAAKDETITTKEQVIATQREALATKDQALAADALAIAELRRRAEQAEAERDRLAAAQAAQDAPGAPEVPTPDNPSGAASQGFWARVRRGFGGA